LPEIEAKAKTPAVQGTLKERPLPRLLQQLYRKQFTGHFVIADETRDESEVYLREGSPVHVCRPVDTDRLDNILVEYGLVPAEVVAKASAQVSEKQRLGDVLERMGVLDKGKLSQVLKAQVSRKLTRLFFVAEGSYAVYAAAHGFGQGSDLQLMRVDPRSVIYPGIRAAYDLPRVTRELSRLANQRFRLADISPTFVAALGVPPEDPTVESLRKGWMMLDDLDTVTSRPFEVRSIVLAMYYTDSLEREAVPPALDSATDSVWPPSASSVSTESPAAAASPSGGAYRISKLSNESGAVFNLDVAAPPAAAKAANGLPPPPVLTPPPVTPVWVAPPPVPATGTAISLTPPPSPADVPSASVAPAASPEPAAAATPVPADPAPPPLVPAVTRPSATIPVVTEPVPPAPRPARTTPVAGVSALTSLPPSQGIPVVRAPFVSAMRAPTKAAPAAPAAPARPAAAAPAKPAAGPGPEGVRAAIMDMAAKLEKSTHFEILGVAIDASSDEIGKAFVRAARQFHPDRLSGAGLADLQPLAERILARVNEAAMVLGSPPRRAEYCESLKVGAQASQNLPTLLEAENQFLRGEVFLKKGDYPKAIEAFNAAVKNNPGEPQYQAYQAWTRFEDPRARKEVIVRETLKILDGVLKERPRFARGYYWVGQLWKFLNESSKAEQAFREAVQVDESLIEASRELRLIEMRKNKGPQKPAKPESKGKFWKR
jgi:curved DNA-binding protein CbpA